MSERARSGLGAGVVPADQGSTVADVGDEAEGRVGVTQCRFAPSAVKRGAETAHRGGELPKRGIGLGSSASPRCSDQRVVQVAASVSHVGGHRRRICPGGGRGERGGARAHGDRTGRGGAGHCRRDGARASVEGEESNLPAMVPLLPLRFRRGVDRVPLAWTRRLPRPPQLHHLFQAVQALDHGNPLFKKKADASDPSYGAPSLAGAQAIGEARFSGGYCMWTVPSRLHCSRARRLPGKFCGDLELSSRGPAAGTPWSQMPEVECVRRLRGLSVKRKYRVWFTTGAPAVSSRRLSPLDQGVRES